MLPLQMITLGTLTAISYPKAIQDETYTTYYAKLSKIQDPDWQCVFLQVVTTKESCEQFLKAYESRFGNL